MHSGDWIRRGQCSLLMVGKLLLSSLVMMAFDVFIFVCLLFLVLFPFYWGGGGGGGVTCIPLMENGNCVSPLGQF